jgi:hypothetical protein
MMPQAGPDKVRPGDAPDAGRPDATKKEVRTACFGGERGRISAVKSGMGIPDWKTADWHAAE